MTNKESWFEGFEPTKVKARTLLLSMEEALLDMKGNERAYNPEDYRQARDRYNKAKQEVFDLMVRGMRPDQLELPFKEFKNGV